MAWTYQSTAYEHRAYPPLTCVVDVEETDVLSARKATSPHFLVWCLAVFTAVGVASAGSAESPIEKITEADLEGVKIHRGPTAISDSDALIMVCTGTRDPMIRENAMTIMTVQAKREPTKNLDSMTSVYDQAYEAALDKYKKVKGRCARLREYKYAAYNSYVHRVLGVSRVSGKGSMPPSSKATIAQPVQQKPATKLADEDIDCQNAWDGYETGRCYQMGKESQTDRLKLITGPAVGYEAWAKVCGDPAGDSHKQAFVSMLKSLPATRSQRLVQHHEQEYASAERAALASQGGRIDYCPTNVRGNRMSYDAMIKMHCADCPKTQSQ